MTSHLHMPRLFFALWPSESVRARMEEATRELAARSHGRMVPVRNLHITLAFIGEVSPARVDAVVESGAQTSGAAFELRLDRVESWQGSRLLCLSSPSTPAPLERLVDQLRCKLLSHDFKLKEQQFRPHVTLVRDMPRPHPATAIAPLAWPVNDFVLVESQRDQDGSVYTVLKRWPLAA